MFIVQHSLDGAVRRDTFHEVITAVICYFAQFVGPCVHLVFARARVLVGECGLDSQPLVDGVSMRHVWRSAYAPQSLACDYASTDFGGEIWPMPSTVSNPAVDTVAADGDIAGFWLRLWHGFIACFAFFVSLFSDSVHIYEIHNNGGWYNFGFVLGAGILFGGSTKTFG